MFNNSFDFIYMTDKTFNPDNYWEDRLHKISGLEGVGFKKLGPSFNKWAYKVRKQVFLQEVAKLPIHFETASVLDIGSGTGFYIQAWRELKAKDITGVDITPTSVENIKKTFPQHNFFQSDIGDAHFNAKGQYKQYDIISSIDVLFHIVDDKRFEQSIANISSLLKPGGYFIYSDNFLKTETVRGESQVSRSKKYLLPVFENNGFKLEVLKPFMYLTNKPIDSQNPLLKAYWTLLENGLYILPFMGHVAGPALYPLELFLVNRAKDSPTTEFAIFKKIN